MIFIFNIVLREQLLSIITEYQNKLKITFCHDQLFVQKKKTNKKKTEYFAYFLIGEPAIILRAAKLS